MRLSDRDAVVLHIRANAVYHLPGDGVVARIRFAPAGQDAIVERATAAIQATRWLTSQGFPAAEPLDIDQPVTVLGHVATFWRYEADTGDRPDTAALGRMIRSLHCQPPPRSRCLKPTCSDRCAATRTPGTCCPRPADWR